MSKTETIDALTKSALQLFAARGFEGTSLRDVATDAQVPLSTIHIYFGTKADLYAAVYMHALRGVNDEREAGLKQALAAPGGKIDPRDLVRALIAPIVRRARSDASEDRCAARMLGNALLPIEVGEEVRRASNWNVWTPQWINALLTACPFLTRPQAVWGFSFVVGAMYSWQVLDNRYDPLLAGSETLDADQVVESLVDFSVGGIERLRKAG